MVAFPSYLDLMHTYKHSVDDKQPYSNSLVSHTHLVPLLSHTWSFEPSQFKCCRFQYHDPLLDRHAQWTVQWVGLGFRCIKLYVATAVVILGASGFQPKVFKKDSMTPLVHPNPL